MKTSSMLRIYRITSVVLLALLALMPLIFRRHILFATFATTVVTLVLIVIAFQVQRLWMLGHAIAKLDALLEFLRDTKRELSPTESKQVEQELAQIRARLLHDSSLKCPSRRKNASTANIPASHPEHYENRESDHDSRLIGYGVACCGCALTPILRRAPRRPSPATIYPNLRSLSPCR